jgi:regulatory protein
MKEFISIAEACQKIEYYCKYQERCHNEVLTKLISFKLNREEIDEVLEYVFKNDLLNEERFAQTYVRGKHRIKLWGKVRIVNELKQRNISQRNITTALKEINEDDYLEYFNKLAERNWDSITERSKPKKQKKFCDYLLRKGYESDLVYRKMKELEVS